MLWVAGADAKIRALRRLVLSAMALAKSGSLNPLNRSISARSLTISGVSAGASTVSALRDKSIIDSAAAIMPP